MELEKEYEQLVKDSKKESDKKETVDPILPSKTPETMTFPVNALPTELKNLCKAGHYAFKIPYEFFAVPGLVALATAIGSKHEVAVNRSMSTKAILYACIIASAGSGKSPAQDMAFKPIYSIQKSKMDEYKKAYSEWLLEKEDYDARKKHSKKSKEPFDEIEPEQPRLRELYTTDATTEALAIMLQNSPEGIVIVQDEFLRLYNSLDSYRGGKGGDLQFYLSLWSHKNIKVNRVSKPPLFVEKPFGSIIGAMTPSGINEIAKDNNTENGFLDRFLFSFPTDVEMMRTVNAGIDEDTERQYHKLIESLTEQQIVGEAETYYLSDEAMRKYLEYEDFVFKEAGKDEKKKSINTKIKLYALRFSLIAHVSKNVHNDCFDKESKVSFESMCQGIEIAEYFRQQTQKIYKKINQSESDKNIERAIHILKTKTQNNEISKRDIQMNMKLKGNEFDEFLNLLQEKKIIAFKAERQVGGAKQIVFHVNPKYLE